MATTKTKEEQEKDELIASYLRGVHDSLARILVETEGRFQSKHDQAKRIIERLLADRGAK